MSTIDLTPGGRSRASDASTVVWDKGLSHIAGNVNGNTIRRFPVVTEVCVLYQRRFEVAAARVAPLWSADVPGQ